MTDTLSTALPGFTPAWWALLVDRDLDHSTVRLYLLLASHARPGRPVAFPSQSRLAGLMNCSTDTIQRSLNQLVKAGWLVKERRGMRRTNLYHLTMPPARAHDWYTDEAVDKAVDGAVDNEDDAAPMRHQEAAPMRHPIGSRRTGSRENAHLAVSAHTESFDAWWSAWPRKVAKADAMKAYVKALTVTDEATLLRAARLVLGRWEKMTPYERKFVPYPATWLNRGQWLDEPDHDSAVPVRPCVMCAACPPGPTTCQASASGYDPEECPWR